jgi:leucine-rich repeat kinase 2
LTFEANIKKEAQRESLVTFKEITEIADSSGIYDQDEVFEAVRFLNDLGSLQYFETNGLKDRVIINPQVT